MKKLLILLLLVPSLSWGGERVKIESFLNLFEPFKCEKLETDFLRLNNLNECLIIQKLSNQYEVKSVDHDTNTWNRPQMIKYVNNSDGEKIIAHTWNNVVKWGEKSKKQPFSHLVVIDIPNLDKLFEISKSELISKHYSLPLTARRLDVLDTDKDGDKEILYLSNKEDGRNRESSWKDVNYIFDLNDQTLKKFGSSHFSHDLMYMDFNKDGYFEILDYFYNPGGKIEICDLKTNKCAKSKNSSKLVDIGFNHIFPSKNGSIMFGGCPGLGDTTFCWSNVNYKNEKLSFNKLDSYKLKPQPTDKANFLIWTGDVQKKPGYWVKGSNKKQFKQADRAWISAAIDYNKDGFIDSVGIEKEVICSRDDTSKPFKRSGGDCKEEAFLYIFKNIDDSEFIKHQVIPTTINDSFIIENADINKDGTLDLYGFRQGYYNPWNVCKTPQLKSLYLNQENKYFEHATQKFIKEKFGLYGCERASSFFEKDGQYYRLFITIPSAESENAYLGIENYTGKN